MEQKWYITLKMDTEDWDQMEEKLQYIEDILQAACTGMGVLIEDFEQK
jgi:hypothetical protein